VLEEKNPLKNPWLLHRAKQKADGWEKKVKQPENNGEKKEKTGGKNGA